jgi:short-subunit dehydrogenase
MDLEAREAMPAITKEALSFYGEVHILIHNAGLSQRSLILNTHLAVYEKLIDVNYLGTIALTKAILPYFIQSRQGHFVTITSLMGKFGSPLRSGYCGAKHALHGFFDVLRMEHEKDGVQVTLVCPGFVQTNIARNALTAQGSPQNRDDSATAGGMPADLFAKKMIRAIIRKKYEVYIGGKETKAVYLKRFFPRLLHRVILNSKVV